MNLSQVSPLLTQEQMAEYLHCHVNQISMLREVGILPAIKTGKSYMFSVETYNNFVNLYTGQDVSNRVRAIEAKKNVMDRLAAL